MTPASTFSAAPLFAGDILARLAGLRQEAAAREGSASTLAPLMRALVEIDEALQSAPSGLKAEAARLASGEGPIASAADLLFASFAMTVGGRAEDARRILDHAMTAKLKPLERSFLFWQLSRFYFLMPAAFDVAADLGLRRLHRQIVRFWARRLDLRRRWVPPERRSAKTVIVMTNQLLGPTHAPTADTLDYVRILHELGYQVEVLCAAELPAQISLPVHRPFLGNYNRRLAGRHALGFEAFSVPLWQAGAAMPNEKDLKHVLRRVAALKPHAVIGVGGSMVGADLCAAATTVITLPLSARPPVGEGQVLCTTRAPEAAEEEALAAFGIAPQRLVPFTYRFRLPPRQGTGDPAPLALPEGALKAAVVSTRFDDEVGDEACAMMHTLLAAIPHLYLLFVGPFARYERLIANDPLLRTRTRALGFQADIRAVYAHCDVYLNLPRSGGGTSAAYALADGLPVLTVGGGDVAWVAGDAFVSPSLPALVERLAALARDPALREAESARARERFGVLSDRKAMLEGILEEVERRALFAMKAPLFSEHRSAGGR